MCDIKTTMEKKNSTDGYENSMSFFVLLKQMVWLLEQNIKMIAFAFWFDINKELNYPFLVTQVIRGLRFFNDFMIQHKSYMRVTLDI